jgi:DNA-binding transcriptional MerR regulator
MRISEVAERAGVSVKAVRYYESAGLLEPDRLANGYREYSERDVRLVREVSTLKSLGIRVDDTRPFLECLVAGNDRADDCPDSLATYRQTIAELDNRIDELAARRAALSALLDEASGRAQSCGCEPA